MEEAIKEHHEKNNETGVCSSSTRYRDSRQGNASARTAMIGDSGRGDGKVGVMSWPRCSRRGSVGKRTTNNGMGHEHDMGREEYKRIWKGWKRTADSVSVKIRCDFPLKLSCCESWATSRAWRCRIST